MAGKIMKAPTTVGGTLMIGAGIVVGAILWWWGKDVYGWIKSKCTKQV